MKKHTFFMGTLVFASLLSVLTACESENQTHSITETHSPAAPKPSKGTENRNKKNQTSYTAEQIEYARVWFMLGPNKQVEELNVTTIPTGTLVNPNDETSAAYPVNVIQLRGPRLVDGSITYSSNGDGTINVYNVPLRWETSVPDDLDESYMKTYTQSLIEHTKKVYVDPTDEKELAILIDVIHMQ